MRATARARTPTLRRSTHRTTAAGTWFRSVDASRAVTGRMASNTCTRAEPTASARQDDARRSSPRLRRPGVEPLGVQVHQELARRVRSIQRIQEAAPRLTLMLQPPTAPGRAAGHRLVLLRPASALELSGVVR